MRTKKTASKAASAAKPPTVGAWIDEEAAGCSFKDARLAKRFGTLLGKMSEAIGESVPHACQDWANTKAAYRFFSNAGVGEDQILAGHFQATRGRLARAGQKILMPHDTCEFSFQRNKDSKTGLLGRPSCGRDKDGRQKHFTVRGLLMHSSLAITLDGLPLGLAAIKVPDPPAVQGVQRPQTQNQSHPRAHYGEGEHPLAGKPASINRTCGPRR